MSLTDTINNTNKQKENIKTVANNIDNKLVELGGERATDLVDVVNKMGAMVTENYKKIAVGSTPLKFVLSRDEIEEKGVLVDETYYKLNKNNRIKIELNIDFKPTYVFLVLDMALFTREDTGDAKLVVYNKEHFVLNNSDIKNKHTATTVAYQNTPSSAPVYVDAINIGEVFLNTYFRRDDFTDWSTTLFLKIQGCKWVAIE